MLEDLNLDDIPDSHKDIVEYIGMDSFKKLVELLGGSFFRFIKRLHWLDLLEIELYENDLMVIISFWLENII